MSFSVRQSLLAGFGVVLGLIVLSSIYVSYETKKIHALQEFLVSVLH